MSHCRMRCFPGLPITLVVVLCGLAGCGSETPSTAPTSAGTTTAETSESGQAQASRPAPPPVVAISNGAAPEVAGGSKVTIEPGSADDLLLQIAELVAAANRDAQQLQHPEESFDETPQAEDATTLAYQRRLGKVVELATQVIARTHLDPALEQQFNNAVHYLSDARLELATAGDAAQAKLLMEDADSLYQRDPASFAASEAGYKVVQLAERMARNLGPADPDWLNEYATQAKLFAERFPEETSRSAMTLFNAGRLCDRLGANAAARQCLELVQSQFAGTVFAEQSTGILRRLDLPNKPLEFAGPTIDGGFAEIEHYRGRPVLIVFWASTSPTFLEHLPILKQMESRFGEQMTVVGVNLDADEATVDQFLTRNELTWPQVFSPDPDQRGGRNPVARYYGIQILPTYWLVDQAGIVKEASGRLETLPEQISSLLQLR